MKKINSLLMLFLFIFGGCARAAEQDFNEQHSDNYLLLAAVSFSERPHAKSAPEKSKKPVRSRSINPPPMPQRIEQYEIEGYIDNEYVRLILDVDSKKNVVGNIYDKLGKETYVHGEYVDGAFHIYDVNGTHFTVLISE